MISVNPGNVATARQALVAAVPTGALDMAEPRPVINDITGNHIISSLRDTVLLGGKSYTAIYDLATPYDCRISAGAQTCDKLRAYSLYALASQPLKEFRIEFNEYAP
jgi:hypothetical protein